MESGVREFEIKPSTLSLQRRLTEAVTLAVLVFIFRGATGSALHWRDANLVPSLIISIVIGALFAALRRGARGGGSLLLGEDFIEGSTRIGSLTLKKRIYRRELKKITETTRGLLLMDRNEFAARMRGFILVPASMPEYPQIKATLSRWAPIGQG
jgi:hypothetical protein